ncbi:hypothetical protein BDQ12DRAFT_708734 [Crucibulum laeve]|uniref:MI domain-containing protein n=1 Tax=Crucibulum laeve TaxID=68775 RepID=A0A5C3MIB3_9AGAR|nr:hypothetical protein BDQ12DRAFT_708734 [Crucibulum laeve]
MSKSSTASASKIPTQLPAKSAWSRGPPQTAPSPRSQSPAPSTPHQTHSRRPSALGQGVPIKDGVSVPRSTVGAVKQQGSAVTFGSIDDVSAPISSSPAAAPPIKSEGVKSFGSVPASTHVNGKASISSRPSATPPAASSSSTTSTPAVSVAATPAKPAKMDIHKLFQNPTSAPSSQPPSDTSSPSMRSSNLPSQSQSSQQGQSAPPPSQPSQLGSHSYTNFVPRAQQQNAGPGGGVPRSPVYPRAMTNGNGPRSQGGPNGAPSAGLSSPRLGPHPHNAQPSGLPPPPQMQMQPQMPQQMWPGYYYQPGLPPDQHYMQYNNAWYPMQQMPPQHQPPHQHQPPPGAHGPPHPGMPMSPRNPPPPLAGPGTPTLSHAAPVHTPHVPPPLAHSSSSMSSIASPPPTPSTASMPSAARLNANSSAFVPTRPKITLKNPADGSEIKLETPSRHSPAASQSNLPPQGGSVYRQGSPGTPNRRPASIRMETEEQRRQRLAEDEAKEKEKARVKAEAEAKVKKEKEELERKAKEEEDRKKKEEEEKIRKEEEEKERVKKEKEEKERKEKEEEERKIMEEEEKKRKEAEAKAAEEERVKKEVEEKAAEEARLKKEAEEKEAERLRVEEEEAAKAKAASEAVILEPAAAPVSEEPTEEGEVDEKPKPSSEQPSAEASPGPREDAKGQLRINTAATPTENLRRRPGPLDLSNTKGIPAALPSALATARIIDDIGSVQYPEGILSPKPELNTNAKDGKFRYDRDFLLQFMAICKDKPDMLPPLDAIGLEPNDQSNLAITRGGSGRHRPSGAPVPSRQASGVGLGFGPGFGKPGVANPFMGNFGTGSKLSSEERFNLANSTRSVSVSAAAGMPFGTRPAQMQRTASQGGPGGAPMSSNRTRSKRGEKRPTDNKPPQGGHGSYAQHQAAQMAMLEPVAPLQATENRWDRKAIQVDADSPEMVDRKVKGLLNKLTMEKFDSISDQIIAWANKSENEKDGRTLIQVIRLVFEKATDEATWSGMYARLCRKMMEQISSKVQDDGIKNSDGKPIAGGQLFRKYLLNRCQEDFERGWVAKEVTAAAAATKALEDKAAQAANEQSKESGTEEVALYSEEYYAAQKAKRQGLGLIKFIGELFKLQMLTERIMHECVKKLLGNVENPEEEEIESLCKLLATVGKSLDVPKAKAHMDVYFSRMRELGKNPNVSSRMQFMLQDLIELRSRNWAARNEVAAPATIAQVHEAAAREKAASEKDYRNNASMSRGGSRRGGDRSDFAQVGPDGWAVAGNSGPPRPPPKAGDLSNFGKISKGAPMTFGPSSVFAGKKGEKRESISRTSSSSNMFSMLSQGADVAEPKSTEAPAQRKRLILQPRSKPSEDQSSSPAPADEEDGSVSGEEDETPAAVEMSDADAKKKVDEDTKEFFGVRNLDEAENYFTALPATHHHRLVDKLVTFAVESKAADAQLVADFFARAVSKQLSSPAAFEEGFSPIAEFIDDIAIDAPKAPELFATMFKAAALDEERRTRVASKSQDSQKLLDLLS